MNNPQKKSSPVMYIILIVVVAGALLYYFYNAGTSTPQSLTLQEESLSNQASGVRVLNLLNEINALRIDNTFFNDKSYQTLRDFTVDIPSLPIGRPNPFAPVPGLVTTPPSTSGR